MENVSIPNPGLNDSDPRQMLFNMLEGCGLSIVFSGPGPVEDVLETAIALAPILSDSSHVGRGFLRLHRDRQTIWTAVEGRNGSAVIVFALPDSDSRMFVEEITIPFERAMRPFQREWVNSGSTTSHIVSLLEEVDLAPVWEFPAMRHVDDDGDRYPTLPASIRRAAKTWLRGGGELYKGMAIDSEGTEVDVFLGLFEVPGHPLLLISLGELPQATYEALATLAAGSDYELNQLGDTVVFAHRVQPGVTEAELNELGAQLANDLGVLWQSLRNVDSPELPVGRGEGSLWTVIEEAPNGATPNRRFAWPVSGATYTYTERIREAFPDEETSFEVLDQWAKALKEKRGSGFEYAWRGDHGALISPPWLTVESAAIDPETGRVVVSGHPTHEVWGMPAAHDLGAIDSRNGFTFSEAGHPGGLLWPSSSLYVGSLRTGVLAPLDSTGNVISVDFHGPSQLIAACEFLGSSTGAVSVFDHTGQRRLLTVLEGTSGNEPIRFSSDGSWLLYSRWNGSELIEVATGRTLVLDVANVGWWSSNNSCLLTVTHQDGVATPRLFSLAENRYTHSFPPITLDIPLLPSSPHFWFPDVSADGQEVLLMTPAGVSVEYQQEHGCGNHLAKVILSSGEGRLVASAFLNEDETLERDVRSARWTTRAHATDVVLHPDLSQQMKSPVTTHEYLSPGRWADEAERILVMTLNRALDLTGDDEDFTHLFPEILAALIPVAHAPEVWERQREWLTGLAETTRNMHRNGSLTGDAATAWGHFGSAIMAVEAGRPELVNPLDALWIG